MFWIMESEVIIRQMRHMSSDHEVRLYYGSIEPAELPNFVGSDPFLCIVLYVRIVVNPLSTKLLRPINGDRILYLIKENIRELCDNCNSHLDLFL
mgnify:CR=1 FL=1